MSRHKRKAQQRHARRRASERLGVRLSKHDIAEICKQITSGKARLIEKQSNRVSVFEVMVAGQQTHAVYDRQRKTIVTFLHPDGDPWKTFLRKGKIALQPKGGATSENDRREETE